MKNLSIIYTVTAFLYYGTTFSQSPDAAQLVSQITTNFIDQHTSIPPSPQAADFGRFGNIPVNHYTGTANITVPVHSVEAGGLTTGITLHYETSGIPVASRPTWTGMGWNLNTGAGAISVTVNGFPDQLDNYFGINTNPPPNVSVNSPAYQDWIKDCVKGKKETQPDLYSINFMGYSGKFYVDNQGNIVFFEYTDLDIDVTIGGTHFFPCVGPFVVTTKEGIQGIFNVPEETTMAIENNEESGEYFPYVNWRTYNSAWYPSIVKSLTGKGEAIYNYENLPEENVEEFR